MENKKSGYRTKQYPFPTKHYCQTLELKDDSELIKEYIKRHSQEEHWPIISEGIKEVGILEMEIFILGSRLFMIVETAEDFEWTKAFAKLATLPRQAEWEEYMSVFQNVKPGSTSDEKWQLMERIFKIYE